jgi:16S rRNA (adenine1518-N6/adenine1519-N6)-dimethyltransferase
MNAQDIKRQMEDLGLWARKSKGQNFLIDERIAQRAVEHAKVGPEDTVLEIGPGLGILTRHLIKKAKRVIAVETEKKFIGLVSADNIEYIHGDALEVDIPPFDKVVSNLPYSISTPLTFRLLGPTFNFKIGVLMYQLEFAQRLGAPPGSKDYSRLSVSAYVRTQVEILDKVPSCSFWPQPKVDSRLVRLIPRPAPFHTRDWEVFHRVVKVAFSQRRKKIHNSIKNGLAELNLPFRSLGAPDLGALPFCDQRPEELSAEQFGQITDFLCGDEG